jgi:6-phosphogluconolactonase
LVGTYGSPKSEGIYVYRFNSANGTAKEVSHIKTSNPSFLAVSPNQQNVYAVNENADSTKYTVTGHVAAFSFNKKNGSLTFLNKQESGGKHPCYVAIDKTGKWVFAGNYSSGSFSVLPVLKNGTLGIAKQTVQHTGSGPDKARQTAPHVHGIFLKKNNNSVYVTDLGIDKIMKYNFDVKRGKLTASKFPDAEADAGSGPRHLDFHPAGKYVYLLEELVGNVSVYKDCHYTIKVLQAVQIYMYLLMVNFYTVATVATQILLAFSL